MSDIKISIRAEIDKSAISSIKQQLKTIEEGTKISLKTDDKFVNETKNQFKRVKSDIERDKVKLNINASEFNRDLKTATSQLQDMYGKAKVTNVSMKDMGNGMREVTAQVKDANGQVKNIKHTFDSSTQSINKQVEGIRGVNRGLQESGNLSKAQLDVLSQIQTREKQIAKLKEESRKMNPNSDEYKKVISELEKAEKTTKEFRKSLDSVNDADMQRLRTDLSETERSIKKVVDVEKAHEQAIKENIKWEKEREQALKKSQVSMREIGSDMESAGQGILKLTAPLAAVGIASGKMAMDYESAFAGVNSCPLY